MERRICSALLLSVPLLVSSKHFGILGRIRPPQYLLSSRRSETRNLPEEFPADLLEQLVQSKDPKAQKSVAQNLSKPAIGMA